VRPVEMTDARDRDLLRRIALGDRESFRRLFARYAPTAMALARRVVRQAHLAEETVQEAFLAVWKKPGGYDPELGSVRAWLMSTVHHRAVDAVRREQAQRRRSDEAMLDAATVEYDHAEAVVEEIGLPEEREAVRQAMGSLPAEQRRVIELMYFEGLSQSRIAERLELPLGTVKSRTLLAMRRLRGELGWIRE
jgi:RNA polymerase sigma factor (sigma-70 family)